MIPEDVQQNPVAAAVAGRFGDSVTGGKIDVGELTLIVDAARIVEICQFLKQTEKFVRLSSLTAVDWFPREPRFEVVYHLQSVERNLNLRVKAQLPGDKPEIDSVYYVWRGSDWYERETFDLFGITFRNHPNLKRLMMPDDWQGHPLRKDYPIHGFKYSYADEQ